MEADCQQTPYQSEATDCPLGGRVRVAAGDSPPSQLLLTIDDLAATLRVSRRHVSALRAAGQLLAPVRLGRAIRWPRTEVEDWILAGCPPLEQWRRIKGGRS